MILPALILFLASLCNAAVRFPPHGVTLAPRAINTSILTVTLAPVTNFNQALVSLPIEYYKEYTTKDI